MAKWNPIFTYIPIESQIEKFQEQYYQAIASCHKAGNSDAFIEFMLDQIDGILDEVSEDSLDPSGYVKKLLSVMEIGVPYSSSEIMKKWGLGQRKHSASII